jgi:cupin fold WbuC family metalloprotein
VNASVKYLNAMSVDAEMLRQLRTLEFAASHTRRICFHGTPDAPFHVMLVEAEEGFAFPPHAHTDSDELSVAVEGVLEIAAWPNGLEKPAQVFRLGDGVSSTLMPRGTPHKTCAVGGNAVYLEAKLGPFRPDALVKYETPDA